MQAKDKFDESIKEILILNEQAEKNSQESKVFYKSIILLLCAKLEKYIKDSANEYVSVIAEKKLTRSKLPEKLVCEIIKNEINFFNNLVNKNDYISKDKNINRAKVFSLIWDEKFIFGTINDDFSISITNNGTTEIKNIYKKIGLEKMFENFPDYISDDMFSITCYGVLDYVNKVINMRHNIIHDDATPSITQSNIELYVNIFKFFISQIDAKLCESLKSIN